MVKTMYYACAHSSPHIGPDGNFLDNWCHLFRFQDLQVNKTFNTFVIKTKGFCCRTARMTYRTSY